MIREIHLDKVDSTNTYAKKHISEFQNDEIVCITAEEQTAGRGRFQKTWYSPRDLNIYATFYFRLPLHSIHLSSIGQILTLSLSLVLLKEGFQLNIKWPNDVQINSKKLAGVLCETIYQKDHVDVILGIGINVNMTAEQLSHIDQPATSLLIETQHIWDREVLLKKIQKQFLADLKKFQLEGFTPFHSQFENLLAYKGQTIRYFDGHKEWVGICHSITNDGQLNIYLPNKEIHTFSSGEIV